jgi:hypothetical protein
MVVVKRRIIMTLVAAVAVGCLIFAFSAPKQGGLTNTPPAIESVFPVPGNLELRQVAVVADLAPGYTGYLAIDGVEVPEDQTQFVDALNTVTLKPSPGSDFGTFQPGPHCATVFYRHIGDPREDSASYRWCFQLS